MKKILFVCTGNICRSPTAHAIARHKAKLLNLENKFYFDSAGTISHHSGESPDARSVMAGEENGISFAGIFSRKITAKDFDNFDLIMAMDKCHYSHLHNLSDTKNRHKIKLFLEFCQVKNPWNNEVIDPYYLKSSDFDKVFKIASQAVDNLLNASNKTQIK